jgi:hypothetical protein
MRLGTIAAGLLLTSALPLRAACTLDGANAVQLFNSATQPITLTTTSTNSEICYFSAAYQSAAAPSVTGITGGGVSFAQRFSHLESGLFGGGFHGKTEMWCGLSATAQSGTTFTATYDLAISSQSIGLIFGVNGINTAAPLDANISLPGYAHNLSGSASISQVSGISTTSPSGFLVALCSQWDSSSGCNVNVSGWTSIFGHVLSSTVSVKGQYKTGLAPQSAITVATLGANITSWTGNVDAFNCGAAGGVGAPVFLHQIPWMMGR